VVPLALADVAGDVDVGQKMHLDLDDAVALAGLAAAALDVEREAAGRVAARLALRQPREPFTDRRKRAGIGGGISALMFFRLLPRAPTTRSTRCGLFGRRSGTAISRTPLRYSPVSEFGLAMMSAGVPSATMWPPCTPAPGPTSTT